MEFEHAGIDARQERRLALALVTLCSPFIIIAVVLGVGNGMGQPVQWGDLSEAQIVEIRAADGRTVLSGEFRTRTDPMGNIEKDAALTDRSGSQVIGEVEIEVPGANRSDQRQELEIDIISLPSNALFTVVVDDRPTATFTTDDRGSIDLEIEAVSGARASERGVAGDSDTLS